jgi:hypothetical protein
MLWKITHLGNKDTIVLAVDQRICASVLHLATIDSRRSHEATRDAASLNGSLNHGAELPESNPFL